MAYAALSDIQGLISQFTIGASTNPTSTQAGVIITDISFEMRRGDTVAIMAPTTNAAAGVAACSGGGMIDLAAGDTLQFMFRNSAANLGLGAYTTSGAAFGTWFSVREVLH
jgi:hypothetical protein